MINLAKELKDWQGRKVLMTIFPHPDDETMGAGGLFLAAHKLGWQTVAVVLTAGEAGQIHIHPNGKTLREIRKEEMEKAASILEISEVISSDFGDGKLRGQEAKIKSYLKRILEKIKPGIIVTYDHSGRSGHPDHIVSSLVVRQLLQKLNSKTEPPLLLWVSLPQNLAARFSPKIAAFASQPTHILNLGRNWFWKWLAIKAHRSQHLGKSLRLPISLFLSIYHYEWYHEVDLKKNYPFKFFDFKI